MLDTHYNSHTMTIVFSFLSVCLFVCLFVPAFFSDTVDPSVTMSHIFVTYMPE